MRIVDGLRLILKEGKRASRDGICWAVGQSTRSHASIKCYCKLFQGKNHPECAESNKLEMNYYNYMQGPGRMSDLI